MIEAHNFFLLRTPLLPYQALLDISSERLKEFYRSTVIQEALFIASPELYQEMLVWLNQSHEKKDKVEIALLKYLMRMSYRCTPFGLFAGVSTGRWGNKTGIDLFSQEQYSRHSRLDMSYLCALSLKVAQFPVVRKELVYYPNNTIYRVGNSIRYVEYRINKNQRSHHLINVETSAPLNTVLMLAKGGTKLQTLIDALIDDNISSDEAADFVNEVIDGQLLVSELEPFVTGEGYLSQLNRKLRPYEKSDFKFNQLGKVLRQLTHLDRQPLGIEVSQYQEIVAGLSSLEIEFELNHLFQVDMSKPVRQNVINPLVIKELKRTIELLTSIVPYDESATLKQFREAFHTRYEEQEVALTEALDAETGVGYLPIGHTSHYGSPLLEEIPLGRIDEPLPSYSWSAWQQLLLEKYLKTIQNNSLVLELSDEEVAPFLNKSAHPLPSSLYSAVQLLSDSGEAVDKGDFQIFHLTTAGPSVARLLGRFCYLDSVLTEEVMVALRDEENHAPNAIFAEIVHLNQARIGNVSLRPVLRQYEIPILAQAGVDESHTLQLDDLMVSIRETRVVLRSKRLNKEVIPRLSTAHNYALQALPQYHFLCDLQRQHTKCNLQWDWGILSQVDFLPQVLYGKTILAVARWILKKTDLKAINNLEESALEYKIKQWRTERSIPQWVVITQSENDQLLDLENHLCRRILQSAGRSKSQLELRECLFNETNLLVNGPEGRFTNELIIPLRYKSDATATSPSSTSSVVDNTIKKANELHYEHSVARNFSIGSEWLYIKLYCGVKTADTIVTEVIAPIAAKMLAEGLIDKWFFIRYSDPGHHLRIRFHSNSVDTSSEFYAPIINAIEKALQPYIEASLITGIKTDIYQRELERYGLDNMTTSETIFFHDSVAVVAILGMLEGDADEEIRWQLALRGVDEILNDFGLDTKAKRELIDRLQAGFKEEFNVIHAEAKKAFGHKFRKARSKIESILLISHPPTEELYPAFQVFKARTKSWKESITYIVQRHQDGNLSVGLNELIISYIHMFLNRFFSSQPRKHELVVYDFLFQYYTSVLARQNRVS